MDRNEEPSEALPADLIFTMPEPNLCGDFQSFGICGPAPVQGGPVRVCLALEATLRTLYGKRRTPIGGPRALAPDALVLHPRQPPDGAP